MTQTLRVYNREKKSNYQNLLFRTGEWLQLPQKRREDYSF